ARVLGIAVQHRLEQFGHLSVQQRHVRAERPLRVETPVRLVDLAHLGLHLRQRQARVLCQCHSVPPLFPNNSSAVNILTLGGIWTYPTAGPNPPAWGGVPGYTSTLHPSLNSAKRLLPSPQGQSRWC